jgi:choloylglycine hydrolase
MVPLDEQKQYVVTGRTMDFGSAMQTVLCMVPRGESFPLIPPSHPYRWTNTYGYVAMTAMIDFAKLELDMPYYSDGMNEKGVSAATLWLPGTEYAAPSTSVENVYIADICSLILGNAASCDEAVALLRTVNVIDFPILRDTNYPPLHVIVCDADGNGVVIEFLGGAMQVTPCSNGVLTNAPDYNWQLLNLTNYETLSVYNSTQQHWGQEINGSGLRGVPGDATPPSRFVRITEMLGTIFSPGSTQEAIGLAQQLLQTVFVPYGTIASLDKHGDPKLADYTQWTVIRDHANRVYYFTSAFNPTLQMVDLNQLDFSASKRHCIQIAQTNWYNDLTDQLPTAGS